MKAAAGDPGAIAFLHRATGHPISRAGGTIKAALALAARHREQAIVRGVPLVQPGGRGMDAGASDVEAGVDARAQLAAERDRLVDAASAEALAYVAAYEEQQLKATAGDKDAIAFLDRAAGHPISRAGRAAESERRHRGACRRPARKCPKSNPKSAKWSQNDTIFACKIVQKTPNFVQKGGCRRAVCA